MSSYSEVIEKLKTEAVFLHNTYEDIAIRYEGGTFFAKMRGKPEYVVHHSTVLVSEALLEAKEITRSQYEQF